MGEVNIRKQKIAETKEWKAYISTILNYINIFKKIKNINMNKVDLKQEIEKKIRKHSSLAVNKAKVEIEDILKNYDNLFEEAYNEYLNNEKNRIVLNESKQQMKKSEKVNVSREKNIQRKTIDLIDIQRKTKKNDEIVGSQIPQRVNSEIKKEEHNSLENSPIKYFSKIEKFKAMMLNWIKEATSNPNLSDIHEIKLEVEKMFIQYKQNNNEFTKKEMAQIIINYGQIFKEQYEFLKEERKDDIWQR